VVRSAAARVPDRTHPLLERRPEERVLLMVVSGDRGLCGAFNANVLRKAFEFLRSRAHQETGVIGMGRKGRDALRKPAAFQWTMVAEYADISASIQAEQAAAIARTVADRYQAREIDAAYIVFNEFKSVLAQNLVLEKLLPIELDPSFTAGAAPPVDYLYEQPAGDLLSRLLPRHIEAQVFRALAESAAAEHAARMTAMDSATNNARELIDKLTLYMNKVRQAAITKEIIEVVSGATSAA
jgi:F-type H+-transporting ATPase subunit gamma